MNKQLQDTQKRIEKITADLEQKLGIGLWWKIHHHFVEGHDGDCETDDEGKVSVFTTTACTTTQWEYRQAKITWYLSRAAALDDDWLIFVAIHEYVHVLNNPMAQLIPVKPINGKLEEFATESLARVIAKGFGYDVPA